MSERTCEEKLTQLHQKLLARGVRHHFTPHPVSVEADRHFSQDPSGQAVKAIVLRATGTHWVHGTGFSVVCNEGDGWQYSVMTKGAKDTRTYQSLRGVVAAVVRAARGRTAGRSSKSAPKGSARGSGAPRRRRSAGRAP